MKTKVAVLEAPGKFGFREDEIEVRPEFIMVRIRVCGLCSWELNHWGGLLGTYPQVIGHEWAGEIVEVGEGVVNLKVGDKVTGLDRYPGGFSEYAILHQNNCVKIAEHVDVKTALGEPLKCIITVVDAAEARPGDFGVILGCGAMGLWCVQALGGSGAGLIAVDIDPEKLEIAKKYGATATINPMKENALEKIAEITNGHMADFVIEGTGQPALLEQGITYLKSSGRGRIVLMSSHSEAAKGFDFRKAIEKSATIIAAHPAYSRNSLDDLRRAVEYLNINKFNMDDIITHKFELDDIEEAFRALESKPKGYLKGVVLP